MRFSEWLDPLRHNDGQDPGDIFWIGIEPKVEPPRPDETWHRGQPERASRLGRISWWTRSPKDAQFYTHGTGEVYTATISPNARLGTYRDLVRAVRESGARREDIHPSSGFDGHNDHDFLYVPKVQKALRDRSLQGILLSDPAFNHEIDTLVALDQRILNPQ